MLSRYFIDHAKENLERVWTNVRYKPCSGLETKANEGCRNLDNMQYKADLGLNTPIETDLGLYIKRKIYIIQIRMTI